MIGIALEGEMMSFQIAKGFGYRFNISFSSKSIAEINEAVNSDLKML